GGEAKWKDYIFSDQLIGDKNQMTFAQRAKRINDKYKGRENDKLANNALEIELKKLAQENDYVKEQHEQNTMNSHLNDLKQYG
ncbi:hypothetical protein, partial [Acinetobacter baumannii]|uniref:hypothetical protein n=1 Tax=Acinetobacter baumannii TaxID=470 RepID=UPI00289B8CAC